MEIFLGYAIICFVLIIIFELCAERYMRKRNISRFILLVFALWLSFFVFLLSAGTRAQGYIHLADGSYKTNKGMLIWASDGQ